MSRAVDPLKGPFVVVEGNRRLTALGGLRDATIRKTLRDPEWDSLPAPGTAEVPPEVPVLLVDHRDRVAPILGYRHITGIAQWDPLPQAKFIADFVDEKAYSFTAVAELIDRPETEVRSYYRNFWIQKQAASEFRLPDAARITEEFGVFTRAMQTPTIRSYIKAPAPRQVDADHFMVPDDRRQHLVRLTTWLYGEPRRKGEKPTRQGLRPGQVITDSRQLTAFGKVLSNKRARRVLEASGDYEAAVDSAKDPQSNLRSRLLSLERAVRTARRDAHGKDLAVLDDLAMLLKRAIKQFEADAHADTGT